MPSTRPGDLPRLALLTIPINGIAIKPLFYVSSSFPCVFICPMPRHYMRCGCCGAADCLVARGTCFGSISTYCLQCQRLMWLSLTQPMPLIVLRSQMSFLHDSQLLYQISLCNTTRLKRIMTGMAKVRDNSIRSALVGALHHIFPKHLITREIHPYIALLGQST